jgi:NAD kinase
MLTVDGREPMALANGTEVTVCKSRKSLRMLRLKDDGFYQTLRNKILNYN